MEAGDAATVVGVSLCIVCTGMPCESVLACQVCMWAVGGELDRLESACPVTSSHACMVLPVSRKALLGNVSCS